MSIAIPQIERAIIQMDSEYGCRYTELINALTEHQRSDRSYLAACYLLSASDEMFNISKQYVSVDGIDFASIRSLVKKTFGEYSEFTAAEVGYSLFTWRDCKVNPHEVAQSGSFWLPLICNALMIQGNMADVSVTEA